MADECTDKSTKEQLSMCLRFLDKNDQGTYEVREEFVGLKHAESVKGAAISGIITSFLSDLNLDVRNVRAQCYDGAANMSGKYNGVQAHIKEIAPEAAYIHCKAHSLNLALIHSSKELSVRNMMSTVQEIAFSFDYSAKRLLAFSDELVENEEVKEHLDRRTKLRTLCKTRWSSRADSLYTFRTAFPVVVSALQVLVQDKDEKASLYLGSILPFEFIIALVVAEHVLSATVALANYLQKTDIDLIEALGEAKIAVQRLTSERNDQAVWEALYQRAIEIACLFDIDPCRPRVVGRQRNRENPPIADISDYWRVSLYYVFLDHLVTEIDARVIKHEDRFLASWLLPSRVNSLPTDVSERIIKAYTSSADITDKEAFFDELARWKMRWNMSNEKPGRLIDTINVINEDLYPSIFNILKILLTMPVSSASCERSFSAMRRIKNYLRTTMSDARMSNIALLHIHRDVNIDIEKVIVAFADAKNRRMQFY